MNKMEKNESIYDDKGRVKNSDVAKAMATTENLFKKRLEGGEKIDQGLIDEQIHLEGLDEQERLALEQKMENIANKIKGALSEEELAFIKNAYSIELVEIMEKVSGKDIKKDGKYF